MTSFKPVTLRDEPNDPMIIEYKTTPNDRDKVTMCRLEVMAMQRHRDPEGLEVGEATMAEWIEARRAFGRHP